MGSEEFIEKNNLSYGGTWNTIKSMFEILQWFWDRKVSNWIACSSLNWNSYAIKRSHAQFIWLRSFVAKAQHDLASLLAHAR